MKNCNCTSELGKKFIGSGDIIKKCNIYELEFLSGRTYSNFETVYTTTTGKEKKKLIPVLHSFCPFCGKAYKK